jgi:DNA-binding NtrC family response regulator
MPGEMPLVMVVDDDAAVRRSVRKILKGMGLEVVEAGGGTEAIARIGEGGYDMVITDLRMPDIDGFAVLARSREKHPAAPVIMLTAHGDVQECVAAMRAGAANFLTKPFHVDELEEIVRQALEAASVPRPSPPPRRGAPPTPRAQQTQMAIIGESPRLKALLETVERVASSDATVLLTGETGTGKEVIARLIHGTSARVGKPMVAVNCGAIPENLVESELFGHAKGSFTGASERRVGRFVQADGGTLFLDEVGELPLSAQVKLLRVLQQREVTPIGEAQPVSVDVRIVAATHRDLEAMVADGKFRDDLYYRLNVVPLDVPPLRQRREDVPLLARHFLDERCRRVARRLAFSAEALEALCRYHWPGNVRELENLIERLTVLTRGDEITVADLPPRVRSGDVPGGDGWPAAPPRLSDEGIDLVKTLEEIEDRLIAEALRRAAGNKSHAAKLLGLNRTTLVEKLKRKGLDG